VQSRESGGAKAGGAVARARRKAGAAGNVGFKDAAGSNAICSGATICAEVSVGAGMGISRSQHGATGAVAGADPCGRLAAGLARRTGRCMVQWPAQWVRIAAVRDAQTASPSTGDKSTVRSNPDAMSFGNRMHSFIHENSTPRCDGAHPVGNLSSGAWPWKAQEATAGAAAMGEAGAASPGPGWRFPETLSLAGAHVLGIGLLHAWGGST